jgi:hypothetical protein
MDVSGVLQKGFFLLCGWACAVPFCVAEFENLREQSFTCYQPSKVVTKFCLYLGFPNCV